MDVENANCKLHLSQCTDLEVVPIPRTIKVDSEITGLEKLVEELHKVFANDYVNVQDVQKLMAGYKSDPRDWRKYAKFDRYRYTRNLVDAGNGAFNIMILCWGAGQASAIHDHADSHCFMKLLSGRLDEVRYDWPKKVQPEIIQKLKNNYTMPRSCSEDNISEEMSALSCQNDVSQNGCNGKSEDDINGVSDIRNTCEKRNDNTENDTNDNKEHTDVNGCRNGEQEDNCHDEYDCESMTETGRTRLEVNDVCYINDALGLHRMENPSHVDGAVSLHLYCPPFDSCRVFDSRTGKPTEVKVTFWSLYGKKVKRVIEADTIAGSQ